MKKIKHKKSEKGFAIALALLLLVVMSLMGASLVIVASTDHKANSLKDNNQQAFYAAESGIAEAKRWLLKQSNANTLKQGTKWFPDSALEFCKFPLFPNLQSKAFTGDQNFWPVAMKGSGDQTDYHVVKKRLDQVITDAQSPEKEELAKYSYEFFITYTPDKYGETKCPRKNPCGPIKETVTGLVGSSIAEGTSYKAGGTSMATYYTIFSCGKGENDTIVPLEAVVTLVQ